MSTVIFLLYSQLVQQAAIWTKNDLKMENNYIQSVTIYKEKNATKHHLREGENENFFFTFWLLFYYTLIFSQQMKWSELKAAETGTTWKMWCGYNLLAQFVSMDACRNWKKMFEYTNDTQSFKWVLVKMFFCFLVGHITIT